MQTPEDPLAAFRALDFQPSAIASAKEMSSTLEQEALIKAHGEAVKHIYDLCGGSAFQPNTRVFTAAYMIEYFAQDYITIDDKTGEERKQLIKTTHEFLKHFNRIEEDLREKDFADIDQEITGAFAGAADRYVAAFEAWRTADLPIALSCITYALRRLRQGVPEDGTMSMEDAAKTDKLRLRFMQLTGEYALARLDEETGFAGRPVPTEASVEEAMQRLSSRISAIDI